MREWNPQPISNLLIGWEFAMKSTSLLWSSAAALVLAGGSAGQSAATFSDSFARGADNKSSYSRTFSASDDSIPYTLKVTNGAADGSLRVKKAWIELNGQMVLDPSLLNKNIARVTIAVRLQRQNQLSVRIKGGQPASFITVTIEPTPSTVLNDPGSPDFDLNQQGIGTPFGVAIDQSGGLAYVADRFRDSIIVFDVATSRVVRWIKDVDGSPVPGDGATTSLALNAATGALVAINNGLGSNQSSLSVLDLAAGSVRILPLSYSGAGIHSFYVAINPRSNVVALDGLYEASRRAYFKNLSGGELIGRDEAMSLAAPAFSPATGEFVYAAASENAKPALITYSLAEPFNRLRRIESSASPGSKFDKLAVNPSNGLAVGVNLRDKSAFIFDLVAGKELARIQLPQLNPSPAAMVDVAINPKYNLAAIVCRGVNLLFVLDLSRLLLMAEIPLPTGVSPLGIDIAYELNRAIVAENGLSSERRNGSILAVQLPTP
jgi:DNA-binding beta-propeller fold protein YncE